MELDSGEGEKIKMEKGHRVEVGRKANPTLFSDDLTISRTQISLELQSPDTSSKRKRDPDDETMVSFQVFGRNPVCVLRGVAGDCPNLAFFKKSESGYLRVGDKISFSLRNPTFFLLKRGANVEEERGMAEALERGERITAEQKKRERDGTKKMRSEDEKEAIQKIDEDLGVESLDTSCIDRVKEFGFLEIGHEFEGYGMTRLKAIREWNWYIEDTGETSEDDENVEGEVPRRQKGGMKKSGDANDDEDWTGEGEDEKKLISKLRKGKGSMSGTTRCKSHSEPAKRSGSHKQTEHPKSQEGNEYEDEDDESLGGFIVNDDELEEEEEEEEVEEYDEDEEE